jgi:hypothetical protein
LLSRARIRAHRLRRPLAVAATTVVVAIAPACAPPPDPLMPAVDLSRIPAGIAGSPVSQVHPTGEAPAPSGDGIGAFRSVCGYSHMNRDDPLLAPNQPGVSHLHSFFGNTLASASTTSPATLRVPGARGTCRGGTANLSAYWVPSLIDTRTGTPLRPTDDMDVYYKSGYGGVAPGQVRLIPKGLRLIGGDAMATTDQGRARGQWGCSAETSYRYHADIPACPGGAKVGMEVDFPQCLAVDGAGRPLIDSPDHRSHAAYPDPPRGCPASHPYPIPAITFVVDWVVPAGADSSVLRLASDHYAGGAGGLSRHGDYIEGWDDAVRDQFVRNCSSQPVDCHSSLLGRGPSGGYEEIYADGRYGQV